MIMSTAIGTILGTVSGYVGGKTDAFIMRFTDIFMSVPSFLSMVVINALFPPKVWSMIIILGLFEWCQIARITRAETLTLKERSISFWLQSIWGQIIKKLYLNILFRI